MTTPSHAASESQFVLPVTNQQVILRNIDGYEYAAWVLEVGIRAITLTRSAPSIDEPIPDTGDAMEMSWPIDHGEQIVAVEFIGNKRPDSDLLWDVKPTGDSYRRQRRNYPRVLTFSPAQVRLPGRETHECMLLDANEVALRIHLAADIASRLAELDYLGVAFDLGGTHFSVTAEIMRVTLAEDGSVDVVLTLGDDHPAREELRESVAVEMAKQETASAPWVD